MKFRISMVIVVIITLVFQGAYIVKDQQSFSELENRMMTALPGFNLNSFFEGNFQTHLEESLKDQILMRNPMIALESSIKAMNRKYFNTVLNLLPDLKHSTGKKEEIPLNKQVVTTYSEATTAFVVEEKKDASKVEIVQETVQSTPQPNSALISQPVTQVPAQQQNSTQTDRAAPAPLAAAHTDFFLKPVGNLYSINNTEYLSYFPQTEQSSKKNSIDMKTLQFKEMQKRFPNLKIYTYYVTKSDDMNWFDKSEKIKTFDYASYLKSKLPENIAFGKLTFANFDEYKELIYKTDHHWNHRGGYRGYSDIYSMMTRDFTLSQMHKPTKELDFNEFGGINFLGSKARESGVEVAPDRFMAYEFSLGDYKSYYYNENQQTLFGKMESYAKGIFDKSKYADHYSSFYGNEEINRLEKLVFPNNQYNLMFITDSNNRPMRRLIASHFSTTVVVEYRRLGDTDLDNIIRNEKIDAVLILGEHKYWSTGSYKFWGYPEK